MSDRLPDPPAADVYFHVGGVLVNPRDPTLQLPDRPMSTVAPTFAVARHHRGTFHLTLKPEGGAHV